MENNRLTDVITRTFELQLPDCDTMDDYLDAILERIRPHSETLAEEDIFTETRWLEVRDEDTYRDAMLHIFRANGEYLLAIDGNILKGGWRTLPGTGNFIIEMGGRNELYDLAFLQEDFFVLRKHGDQQRKGLRKYFMMAREEHIAGLEWRDSVELLFNVYRRSYHTVFYLALGLVLLFLFVYFLS